MNYLYELNASVGPDSLDNANEAADFKSVGMLLTTDKSASHYQVKSPEIEVKKGREHCVTFTIDLIEGGMALGILDSERQKWIAQVPLSVGVKDEQSVTFKATSKTCQLVLSTDNAKPKVSIANISRIAMHQSSAD